MKLVTGANRPVGLGENLTGAKVATIKNMNFKKTNILFSFTAQFKRAVKIATGHELSENVLDTVFKLFDMDGDNCLSHKEFINVMKDRVLRGLKVSQSFSFLNICHREGWLKRL